MGNNKYNNKKLAFIKKYDIKKGNYLSNDLVRKARIEIGYSKKTHGTGIRSAMSEFIRANNFICL